MSKRRFASVFIIVLALVICTGTVYGQSLSWTGNGSSNHVQLVNIPGLAPEPGLSYTLSVAGSASTFTVSTTNAPPAWLTVTPSTSPGDTTIANNLTISTSTAALTAHSISSAQMGVTFGLTPSDLSGDVTVTLDLLWTNAPFTATGQAGNGQFVLPAYNHGNTPSITASIFVPSPVTSVGYTWDPTTPMPSWLVPLPGGAVVSGSATVITFTTIPAVLNGLPPLTYTIPLNLKVAGCSTCAVLTLTVSEYVQPVTGTDVVSISGRDANNAVVTTGSTALTWSTGGATSFPVTVVASPTNLPFTASCATTSSNLNYSAPSPCTVTLGSQTGTLVTGLAGTFGVTLYGKFDPGYFDIANNGAKYNDTVTMVITISPQGLSSVPFTYNFSMPVPAAAITSVSPTQLSQVPNGGSSIVLVNGTGFVPAGWIKTGGATNVFTGSASNAIAAPTGGLTYVVNSSTLITLTIPDAALPSTGTPPTLWIGVANQPTSVSPAAPAYNATKGASNPAFASVTVVTTPVISAITNSASYVQPLPGVKPTLTPYELISIFGTNFDTNAMDLAKADPVKGQFATTLKTGAGNATNLQVAFATVGSTTYTYAPILFATPYQINAIVPSSLTITSPTIYNVTVVSGANSSVAFPVTLTAGAPGVFSIDSSGYGQAAAINGGPTSTAGTLNGSLNPASAGDIISLYVTGLGVPDATTTTNTLTYPTSCMTGAAYVVAAVAGGATGLVGIDGDIIASKYLGITAPGVGKLPPCFTNTGGGAHVVTVNFACPSVPGAAVPSATTQANSYAGFVADSVAGLYQVNVPIPAGLNGGDCPISITTGASGIYASQSTATINVTGH